MENPSVFIKVHLAAIIMSAAAIIASVVVLYLLKSKPEKLGFKTKPSRKAYLLALAPLLLVAYVFFQAENESLTYPTGISLHQNTIIVDGVVETIRERSENGDTYVEEHSRTFLYDKNTGKEIASLQGFTPLFCKGNNLIGAGSMGYPIVDLSTGKVMKILNGENVTAGVDELTGEKTPFRLDTSNEKFASSKIELYEGEILCKNKDGITLVVSYDDSQRHSFLISALSATGELLWTGRDRDISGKLDGEEFEIEGTYKNTMIDDKNFYFVTRNYLACASLADGKLKWIISI